MQTLTMPWRPAKQAPHKKHLVKQSILGLNSEQTTSYKGP